MEDRLFRVPADILKESDHFCEMLEDHRIGEPGEGGSDNQPVALIGITRLEMSCFLDILRRP